MKGVGWLVREAGRHVRGRVAWHEVRVVDSVTGHMACLTLELPSWKQCITSFFIF